MTDLEWIDRQPERPPRPGLQSPQEYRARVREGRNAMGAAYRLCTLAQPSSRFELVRNVWHTGRPPADVFDACADGYQQWLDAGRPVAVRAKG